AYDKAATTWEGAANSFAKTGAVQMVAMAYDLAAGAWAQKGGSWDKAAKDWEASAQQLSQSTTPDWAAVAYEYAANAWLNKGDSNSKVAAAKDAEAAAKVWEQYASSGTAGIDTGAILRAASYDWYLASKTYSALATLGGGSAASYTQSAQTDQASSTADWNATAGWTAS